MDEILPGLWVGGVRAAMDADYLSRAGITHIITCMKQQIPVPPPLPPDGRTISRDHMKHVRIDDEEKAPILVHFAGCNELISCQLEEEFVPDSSPPTPSSEEEADGDEVELLVQGRQKRSGVWGTWQTTGGGTVLVHCQAGCSRSVAIVAAYLMRTRQISASTAIGMIAMRRKDAEPNRGFKAQLELYQQVGYEIDMKWQAVRRFLMSKTDILNGDSMDDMLLSYYPSPYPSPALSAASAGINGFTTITTNHVVDPTSTLTLDQSKNVASQRESKNSIQIQNPTLCPSRSASSSSSTTTTTTTTGSSSSTSAGARISHLSSIPFQPSSVSQLSTQLSTMSSTTPSTTIQDTTQEVKVTASSSNRLPGGVSQIRGHESVDNRGCLPKPSFKGPKLRCKGCRRELAALDHVVIHEAGKGQLAFDHRKRDAGHVGSNVVSGPGGQEGEVERVASGGADSAVGGEGKAQEEMTNGTTATVPTPAEGLVSTKRTIQSAASLASQLPPHLAALRATRPRPVQPHPSTSAPPLTPSPTSSSTSTSTSIQSTSTLSSMLKSATCSSYFLEPMAWMTGLNSGQVTGRLNCPTAKCGQKLGSWDWAGMQCACGAWVTPAFSLHRSKVDEV
ncbi:related to Tyrosine specific protein phosphatase and dual specificity protein phosphatase [Ustilago trichophora]|uniref:protein-tyrosine-phosphatase n=1 Tax=Ustilago trichophora TaxID=86804 RepID=A0A5C3EN89_9BASI|nr:related to Tyrosine specific protein phosphatase and dual specificity protein phosphatase [Ustilago trichophora]